MRDIGFIPSSGLEGFQMRKDLEHRVGESHQADQDDEVRREESHDEIVGVFHAIGRKEEIDAEQQEQQGQKSDGDLPDPEDVCHKNPPMAMQGFLYNGFSPSMQEENRV
jgi:hypothetical protein